MKIKKKTAMITSFALGTVMFATTVFAEVSSKSGYEQAKDALKYSAESFSNKLSNYTIDASLALKDNDKIVMSTNWTGKFDRTKNIEEVNDTETIGNKKVKGYTYTDKTSRIDYDSDNNLYNVTEFKKPISGFSPENPFKEERASDIEKIGDAIIGNLKDYVVVENKTDGSKELSGSVNQTQIPALINAASSYMLKNETPTHSRRGSSEDSLIPSIAKDVYIKNVKGKMLTDKNGLIQNVSGTGTLYGKDDKGKEHDLTFELLVKVSNINSTVIKKPNLSGKKVEKIIENNTDELANPEKYIGKYKNDMIIEKDGKFIKVGERILNITNSDKNSISGTYEEKYSKGYENYKPKVTSIKFTAKFSDDDRYSCSFDIEGLSNKGNIYVDRSTSRIDFSIPNNSRRIVSNDTFTRIFD